MKVEVIAIPRSLVGSTEGMSVPPMRIRGKGGNPLMEMGARFGAFGGKSQSADFWNVT